MPRKYIKGVHYSPQTEFKKGEKPWNKGKQGIYSKESIKKMRENHNSKGMLGKKHTEKTKRKLKMTNKGREKSPLAYSFPKGKNHPNWKGGVNPINDTIKKSIEFRLWREAVFARDNWTCQKYGTKGGKLHPHHIQNFSQYSELRFAIDNGITFSAKAHREFHKKYGRKNNTKEQLKEFLLQ